MAKYSYFTILPFCYLFLLSHQDSITLQIHLTGKLFTDESYH